jgi:hypothetical protein
MSCLIDTFSSDMYITGQKYLFILFLFSAVYPHLQYKKTCQEHQGNSIDLCKENCGIHLEIKGLGFIKYSAENLPIHLSSINLDLNMFRL